MSAPTVTKLDLPPALLWSAGNSRDCAIQSAWASHQKRGNSQADSIQSPISDPYQPCGSVQHVFSDCCSYEMTLPVVHYRQSEFFMPWRWRKCNPIPRFIFDIPYGLYFSVVPGRLALNDLLQTGNAGGGMGTGVTWPPFSLTQGDYQAVTDAWREFDLRAILKIRERDVPDLSFIFDDEILAIPKHLDYLKRSSAKYSTHYFGDAATVSTSNLKKR